MVQLTNIFWGDLGITGLAILFNKQSLLQVIPKKTMTYPEKLNAISRLIIYISVILSFYQGSVLYLLLGVIILFLIYLWSHLSGNYIRETLDKSSNSNSNSKSNSNYNFKQNNKLLKKKKIKHVYVKPTANNPFMNVLPTSYQIPNRISELADKDHSYEEVQSSINDKFTQGLYQDVSDIYGSLQSQRQFYTMPNTSIPNDQATFAEWLYSSSGKK